MPSITKPSNAVDINDYRNILRCKMHAYLAFGTMEDDEIPVYAKDIADMIEEDAETQVFVPLGDLAKDPIEYGWARETEEVHAGKIRGLLNIEGMVKCINVGQDMIDLLDEKGFEGDCTLMLLPFKNPNWDDVNEDNPMFAVIVRGVSIVDSGKGNGNNRFGEVLLSYNAQPDEIRDGILMLKYDAPLLWPGDIVGGAVFIDCFSEENVYDEGLGKYTTVANLAQADNNLGIIEAFPYKSVNNAFEMDGGNTFVEFGGGLSLKHLIMVVSPDNVDTGDMVILGSDDISQLGLRVSGDQCQLLDIDGGAIGNAIGDFIGAKTLIEINTETAPYILVGGDDISASKDGGWSDSELLRIGGPQGDTYKGEIYGLFAAVRELTSVERAGVVNWMKKRYGITWW